MATNPYSVERNITYGIIERNHNALGTAGAPSGTPDFDIASSLAAINATYLPIEGSVMINKNVQQRRPNRADAKTVDYLGAVDNDIYGAAPTFQLSFPATYATLDALLYGIFQRVSEGATTPFVKTFQIPTVSLRPDFSANAGYYFGFVKESAALLGSVEIAETVSSCIPTSLTISCYPDQNDGRLWIMADCKGRIHVENVTYSGTLTVPTTFSYWNFAQLLSGGVTIGGAAVMCKGFSFTITNGAMFIPVEGFSASGYPSQNIALPRWNISGSIDCVLAGGTEFTAIIEEDSSADVPIVIAWGNATPAATGDLAIEANVLFGSDSNQGSTAESVRRINFTGLWDGSNDALKVTIANALDRGW